MDVRLRPRVPADDDALFAISADLDTWEERNPGPPAPMARERFDARTREHAESDGSAAVSFVVAVDGQVAGSVVLFRIDAYARHAELGIALSPDFRGRGVGTEAVRQLTAFAFERHNLRRVHLEVLASNAAAIRAYEKAGFVEEGRRREHAWVRGRYEDMVIMGILQAERRDLSN